VSESNLIAEFQDTVRSSHKVLPRGGGTKPALSTPVDDALTVLDVSRLNGIIEYEPGEYTFTAYAGAPLKKIVAALAEHGQYLPFDPLLVEQGATLGGTVAANTAGPGRVRYGGVRDFILGARFIDGQGQVVRGGGKVVKNSAGFDLPKFMVGSAGRFGVLVELSFKVFPQPPAFTTLKLTYPGLEAALDAIYCLATRPIELDALDLEATEDRRFALLFRLGGLAEALPERIERLQALMQAESRLAGADTIEGQAEAALWAGVNACAWADPEASLIKVPLSPRQLPALEAQLPPGKRRYSAGGNIAWLSTAEVEAVDNALTKLELPGLQLWGQPGRPYLGHRKGVSMARRVQRALDPQGKFLEA
jgi:glycolate oxidase FAD binding subunit